MKARTIIALMIALWIASPAILSSLEKFILKVIDLGIKIVEGFSF